VWVKGFSSGGHTAASPRHKDEIKRKRGLEEESEAGTLIALANEVRLTSLKLGAKQNFLL